MAVVQCIQGTMDPLIAEALGIHFGVMRALQMGWRNVIIETDSLTLTKILKEGSQTGYDLRTIIEDVRFLSNMMDKPEWNHIRREANMVAHNLAAKEPMGDTTTTTWLSSFPEYIIWWASRDTSQPQTVRD